MCFTQKAFATKKGRRADRGPVLHAEREASSFGVKKKKKAYRPSQYALPQPLPPYPPLNPPKPKPKPSRGPADRAGGGGVGRGRGGGLGGDLNDDDDDVAGLGSNHRSRSLSPRSRPPLRGAGLAAGSLEAGAPEAAVAGRDRGPTLGMHRAGLGAHLLLPALSVGAAWLLDLFIRAVENHVEWTAKHHIISGERARVLGGRC